MLIRKIAIALIPHGIIQYRLRKKNVAELAKSKAILEERNSFHEERRKRIASTQSSDANSKLLDPLNRQAVFTFLEKRGIPHNHLLEGSIPEKSLCFLHESLLTAFDGRKPLLALHIGNFVGVSLASFTYSLTCINPESRVVAIDPNLTHRGIFNPQSHVCALLTACCLQKNVILLAGYSGEKSISNDGVIIDGYDPSEQFAEECACENTIQTISHFINGSLNVVLMDGNHEANYLRSEIQRVLPLMQIGCYLILDDVDVYWGELKAIFDSIAEFGFEIVGTDGRIGIAKLVREV